MGNPVIKEVVALLKHFDVEYVVCSPGSRNAALLQEVDLYQDFKKLVIIDERTAAFTALGIASVSRKPVVLICTSGSALLNYAPAVAEAFYQGIPLIIISADRPMEWIDQDDSQTIRQNGILSNITKAGYDVSALRSDADYIWYVNRIVNEGCLTALSRKMGPVHINIHLSGKIEESEPDPSDKRRIEVVSGSQLLGSHEIRRLADSLAGKRLLLVAGFMPPDNKLQQAVAMFSELSNVVTMAETVSNLHLPQEYYIIDKVLFPLQEKEAKALAPDIVISLGGALISRKLKEFLRKYPPQAHYLFSYADKLIDCFQSLTTKLECDPSSLLKSLAKRLNKFNEREGSILWKNIWTQKRNEAQTPIRDIEWSDLKALSILFNALPQDTNLFLSNGTVVRYGQIIPYTPTHATYSNRGVSGIEGCSSTAIGGSLVYKRLTCLITGDMSFCYDIGAIMSQIADEKMRIVVLDNNGGDIFRFISATKNLDIREEYLCAPRDLPIESIMESLGWVYYHADNEKRLKSILKDFFADSIVPKILHIDTTKSANSEILTDFLMNKLN